MKQDRRLDILQAAYQIVATSGLEDLHHRSVAAVVGLNHAAVHYYFPKRPDLVFGVWTYAKTRWESDRAKLVPDGSTGARRLEAELALAVAYCKPGSRFWRVFGNLCVAAQIQDDLAASMRQFWKGWTKAIGQALKAAVSEGEVDPNSPFADPQVLAQAILGAGMSARVLDSKSTLDPIIDSLFTD